MHSLWYAYSRKIENKLPSFLTANCKADALTTKQLWMINNWGDLVHIYFKNSLYFLLNKSLKAAYQSLSESFLDLRAAALTLPDKYEIEKQWSLTSFGHLYHCFYSVFFWQCPNFHWITPKVITFDLYKIS